MYNKWTDSKYILGCAIFVTTPYAIFSKCMQDNELNLLAELTCLLRTIKETVVNIQIDKNVYQLQKLKNLRETKFT